MHAIVSVDNPGQSAPVPAFGGEEHDLVLVRVPDPHVTLQAPFAHTFHPPLTLHCKVKSK